MSESICSAEKHQWQETYYGYKCTECGTFVPFGSEPWVNIEDDAIGAVPDPVTLVPTGGRNRHEHGKSS